METNEVSFEKDIEARLGKIEPEIAREVLLDLLADEISPLIALSRLLLALGGAGETEELLASIAHRWGRPLDSRLRETARLLHDHREGCERVAAMLREHPDPARMSGPPEEVVATFRRFFDRSVTRNEEASVAAYSLGTPEILQRVTEEIVALFDGWGLLGPRLRVLEIGCGIGRMQAALSPRVAEAHGVDISPKMIEAARRRCSGLQNVRFSVSSGRDLTGFDDESLDLVLAVDSFPYIHQAGPQTVETYFEEAARVLVAGGEFILLNFSYRDDTEADRADVRRLCRAAGFSVVMNGAQPFELWDGVVFRMRKNL
ncbi:MAG TPA: methyltransferase domain-containing protein [Thermoanaerobaculia bacterium]|jgi:SAM-dependent methyltransferase|nr:methyltransferase domain-containing protein [Thermoanaerobaculia bacterium]